MSKPRKDIEDIIVDMESDNAVMGYQYFTNLKNRSIIFNEMCEPDVVEKVGLPLLAFERDNSNDPVDLYINSNGGEVFPTLWICNVIDNYKKPLRIHLLGYALSMAGVLACAGFNNPNVTKDCYPFTIGMLHAGNITLSGTAGQTKRFINFNDNLETKVKNYILTHSHISEEEYEDKNSDDWWMLGEDLLRLGIVDKIIGEDNVETKE